jgi:hypothetical protein
VGTLTQLTNKVRLTGGAYDDFNSGVRMYSRAKLTKPFKVRLKFTRKLIPSTTTNEGCFNLLGLVVTTSSAPTPIPANWPAGTTTRDTEVASFLKGFRFGVANINSAGTANNNRFRLQTYNGDGTRTQYVSDVEVNLGLDVEQELEFTTTGSTATLTAVGLAISVSHTVPLIGDMTTGYLMFYTSYGMSTEWGDVRRIS